jgi:uracil-DNA glycosylase
MSPDQIRHYLEFYRDLGIDSLVRREPKAVPSELETVSNPLIAAASSLELGAATFPEPTEVMPKKNAPAIPILSESMLELPPLAPPDDTLEKIRQDLGDCRRCRLCETRKNIVFGDGNEQSKIVFVGEGPGADEDQQGIPFVGRAGQLLTQMIDATAEKEGFPLRRSTAYIANVVKCRPPENRTPEPDEMEICGQFLYRQLLALKPKVIVALGGTAAKALLNKKEGVTKLRGNWHQWNGIPVMVTWHPSYLLRPYNATQGKREAWEDLKKAFHFLYDESRTIPEL